MSAAEDEKAYHLWIGRKVSTLRRARLDCGHPKVDAVYFHIGCDRLSCSEDCAGAEHDCAVYGGVEEQKSGTEKGPETVEAAAPVPLVQCDTSPWVSFADVAAGPSDGGDPATVDLRRRVQDGTAPAPDRVTEAFRAEVLRQGFTEYEENARCWRYEGGEWVEALRPEPIRSRFPKPVGRDTIDLALCNDRLDSLFGDVLYCAEEPGHALPHRRGTASWTTPADFADHLEPVPPHVDESLEPAPAVRLPWWKRWHR